MKILLLLFSFLAFSEASYTTLINTNYVNKFDYLELTTTDKFISLGYYNQENNDGFYSIYEINEYGNLKFRSSVCPYDNFSLVSNLRIEGYEFLDKLYINGITDLHLVFEPNRINYRASYFSCFYLLPDFIVSINLYNSLK